MNTFTRLVSTAMLLATGIAQGQSMQSDMSMPMKPAGAASAQADDVLVIAATASLEEDALRPNEPTGEDDLPQACTTVGGCAQRALRAPVAGQGASTKSTVRSLLRSMSVDSVATSGALAASVYAPADSTSLSTGNDVAAAA